MIFEDEDLLRQRIESLLNRKVHGEIRVTDDTTEYFEIEAETVLRLDGSDYYVRGDAYEGRFGISDQPKFWVKHATDLGDGSRKILKLVFHEHFTTPLGARTVHCIREADKESRVLALVKDDRRFMQGKTVTDAAGNNVRIIDFIRGDTLFNWIGSRKESHEHYYHHTLPGILHKLKGSIEALEHLHEHGLIHGDIRNDHIIVESQTGDFRWIDFDYEADCVDYDLWAVGNLLTYAVGKGIQTCADANKKLQQQELDRDSIHAGDALLFYHYRLANLRKLYPYVAEPLNDVLMRFSAGCNTPYASCAEIARDLGTVLDVVYARS